MKRLSQKGFTLVEIMIVVAIIALLAAIAIPNLLRARLNANESAAIATMQTYSTALQSYQAASPSIGFPADFGGLNPGGQQPPYVDLSLAVNGVVNRQGYDFDYTPVGATSPETQFHIFAVPSTANVSGVRGFYIDEQGVPCFIAVAAGDPGHAAAGAVCPGTHTMLQ